MFSKIKLVVVALLFAFVPIQVSAQASSIIPNEKHYYTVQLRSDDRTLNYANIIFENKHSEQETANYKFRLPQGVTAQKLTAQQVLAKRADGMPAPCQTYETYDEWQQRTGNNVNNGSQRTSEHLTQSAYERDKLCLVKDSDADSKYNEDFNFDNKTSSSRSYYDYYYYSKPNDEFHYSDLEVSENNGEYTINLSNPIKPGKQGSILISYIADGVVSGALGVYNYDYRTLISNDMVARATVAINFDEGLYSRDVNQKREVESSSGSTSGSLAAGLEASSGAPSRSTDNVLSSVGQGGVYTKTQSNLLPGDVMSIKGTYAEQPFQLFLKEIFVTLLVIAAVVIWAIVWRRNYLAKRPKRHAASDIDGDSSSADSAGSDVILEKRMAKLATGEAAIESGRLEPLNGIRLVAVSGISIAIAVAISALWLGLIAVIQDQSYGDITKFMYFAIISWIVLVPFAIFVLPLAHLLKYGAKTISRWIVIHFVVILAASLVLILFMFAISFNPGSGPTPYDYLN